MAERSSFFEQASVIGSSNSNRYSYVAGYEQNEQKDSEYNSQDSKSSNVSNTVSEIEEDEKEEDAINEENDSSQKSTENSEWSKKFKDKLFDKFKKIVKKVERKKKNDYNYILSAIQNNEDEEVLNILTEINFKKFYRNNDNLFEKDVFMDELIKYKKFELIKKLIEDPKYEFNNDYIFDCLFYCIHPQKNQK